MAAKDGGNKDRNPGTGDAAASDSGDAAAIQRLIDGDGSRPPDGANANNGNANGGDKRESGNSGSAGGGGGISGGGSDNESGDGDGSSEGTGTGKRTRNSSRSSGRTDNSNTANQKTRASVNDVSGKQSVKTPKEPKQPKIELDDIPGTNKEIIGDIFQFVFWGIGQATGVPEWELEDDDAGTIGDNGDKWLKSLGPKRAKNVINGLKKVGPSVAFFGSVGMALVPRVKITFDRAKNGAIRPLKERNSSNTNNSVDAAPPSNPSISRSIDPNESAGFRARPLTAQDIGEATQGFAGESTGG